MLIVLCNLRFSAAHCLNINGRVLKAEEVKVGLGRLSVDWSNNEAGSIILSVSSLLVTILHLPVLNMSNYLLHSIHFGRESLRMKCSSC